MGEQTTETIDLAAAGDAIPTQRLQGRPGMDFERLQSILADTDVGVLNFESIVHDFEGHPHAQTGDVYLHSPPESLDELSALGFDLFAAAQNHVGDYTYEGMRSTMDAFDRRGLAYTGLGATLTDARSPTYVETPSGRVALVATTTSYLDDTVAADPGDGVRGRPGISPLGLDVTYTVPEADLERLRDLSERLGLEAIKDRRNELGFPPPFGGYEAESDLQFMNVAGSDIEFEAGEAYDIRLEPDPSDFAAVRSQIEAAERQADWVVASIHAHQGAGGRNTDRSVPPALETVARGFVDAGADAVVGHGPHLLRGMERYDGAPIFYSLGNFVFQAGTLEKLPPEAYEQYDLGTGATPADWTDAAEYDSDGEPRGFLTDRGFYESILPVMHLGPDGCREIDLYPLDLGFEEPRPGRGLPSVATGDAGRRIIEAFASLSETYGTSIEWDGATGRVRL